MSRARGLARLGGVALGAAGAIVGAGYAGQRVLVRRLRRRPDGDAARALDAPMYVDRRLDSFDGGSIYVVESGEGPPIVLSHGVTNSMRAWFHQLEALPRAGFRTIAFDHRGHGQSVVGSAGTRSRTSPDDMRSVVEGLDLRGAVLVGHSMGGVAVQAFVTQFPEIAAERVAGIVLLSTLAKTPFGSHSTRSKKRIEQITNHVPDMSWVWSQPNLGFLLARIGFGRDPHPSHVELVRQMMRDCPPETRLVAPRALVGFDLTADLPNVDIPTLVIVGTGDILTPPAQARLIAKLIPDARLEVFPGGGHMLMLERADELDRLIIDFAREVGAAGKHLDRRRVRARRRSLTRMFAIPIAGVRVGHWTGTGTGVTVVLPPDGTVGVGRGARRRARDARARAARARRARSTRVDAVVLAGGSAFGLAAADGVMRFLAERGQGFPTAGGPVPIVPDRLRVRSRASRESSRPGPTTATRPPPRPRRTTTIGRVGAGRGATVGKWRGREHAVAGGFGAAAARADDAARGRVRRGERGRRRGRRRRDRRRGLDRAAGCAGFPVDHAVRRGAAPTRRSSSSSPTPCSTSPRAISSRRARTTGSPGRCGRPTPASTATSRSRSRPGRSRRTSIGCAPVAADVVAEAIRVAPR